MIILIDGYNLLRFIFPTIKGDLARQRIQFIKLLGFYKEKKQASVKELIVVFDAGPFSHATREIRGGVTVMFSGQRSNADDWIFDYVVAHKGYEILLVTLDRPLSARVKPFNVHCMDVDEFYNAVKDVLLENVENKVLSHQHDLQVYENDIDDDEITVTSDRAALNAMMEGASRMIQQKNDTDYSDSNKQKSFSRKDSKKNKHQARILKKIK